MQAAFDARNAGKPTPYDLSISCGSAPYLGDDPVSLEELIARADELMYQDKQIHEGRPYGPDDRP